jgi:hypothetical protein
MAVEKTYGCGMRVTVSDDQRTTVEITNVREFRDALGDDIIVSLARAAFAVDRLLSIHTLAEIHNSAPREPDDETRRARDYFTLICLGWGYLHELASALDELEKANIRELLTNETTWDYLAEIRTTWYGDGHDPIAKRLRNGLAFHPGDRERMRDALEKWRDDEVMSVHEGCGRYARNGHWALGLNLILRSETEIVPPEEPSSGAENSDEKARLKRLMAFVDKTIGPQFSAGEMFYALLLDLVVTNDGKNRITPPRQRRGRYRIQALVIDPSDGVQSVTEVADREDDLRTAIDVASRKRCEAPATTVVILDAKKGRLVDERQARIRLAAEARRAAQGS